VVRRARDGEKLKLLDGSDHDLVADDLVIADAHDAVALAGVMGGAGTEIGPASRRILLECAHFEPRGVRRTARRHGLHTEASHRFERGVDPGAVAPALAQATRLITELAHASAVPGALHVVSAASPRKSVKLRWGRVRALLGIDVDPGEAAASLERLGCTVER